MILVTGGAGFIGSNIVFDLLEKGEKVVVCDYFGSDDKWKNLRRCNLQDVIHPRELIFYLEKNEDSITSVIHMGAISSTTEKDVDKILETNFLLSKDIWHWCSKNGTDLVYASSASTYGDGSYGFSDEHPVIADFKPLNPYGWSKQLFDCFATQQVKTPPNWYGLKFFNVFGPNEYHKGDMMSVVAKKFEDIKNGNHVKLFKSYEDNVADGEQKRDFVYVKDCSNVVLWLLENRPKSDIYNVGTGQATSFNSLIETLYLSLGKEPNIEYIDMPKDIRQHYQYYTEATMTKLRGVGYNQGITSATGGVRDYVNNYLNTDDPYL